MVRIIAKWSWNVDIDRNQIEMEIGRNFFVDLRKILSLNKLFKFFCHKCWFFTFNSWKTFDILFQFDKYLYYIVMTMKS